MEFLETFSFWKDCLSRNKIFVAFGKIVNLGLGKSENFIFKIIELIFWKEIKNKTMWALKQKGNNWADFYNQETVWPVG